MGLSAQLMGGLFFISYLILAISWPLSGPILAVTLTLLSSLVALYVGLSANEPSVFLQIPVYACLFLALAAYLERMESRNNDKQILIEKLTEEIHLTRAANEKQRSLREALSRKIARLFDLQKFSERLKEAKRVEDAAAHIVSEAKEALEKTEECVLYVVDEAKQELSLVASAQKSEKRPIKEKEGSIFDRWVLRRSQGLMIEDAHNDFRFAAETGSEHQHLRSVCVSPLISEGKVLGVVRTGSRSPRAFTTDDLRLLDIFSSLGAVFLKNILLYRKMGRLAIRDSLSGLYLNRYFQERLQEEIHRAHFDQRIFSVLLLDIDFFKHTNDEYGHAAGDMVLKIVASIISRCLAPVDLAARYGGEEFIVLLPSKSREEAMQMAEKIRSKIEDYRFAVRRAEISVTASLGVAEFPKDGRTKEELIWKVDKNLYQAKRQGRNRVCGSS